MCKYKKEKLEIIEKEKALIWRTLENIKKIKEEKEKKIWIALIKIEIEMIIRLEKKKSEKLKEELKEYIKIKNKRRIEKELIEYLYNPKIVEAYLKANPEKHIEDMYNC